MKGSLVSAAVTLVIVCICFVIRAIEPDTNVALLAVGLTSTYFVGCFLEYFRSKKIINSIAQDATIFASVVKQLWQDDPILANSVWKKAVPKVIPPWHQDAAAQGGIDAGTGS